MEAQILKFADIKCYLVRDKNLPVGIHSFEVNEKQLAMLKEMLDGQPICLTIKTKNNLK